MKKSFQLSYQIMFVISATEILINTLLGYITLPFAWSMFTITGFLTFIKIIVRIINKKLY